MLELPQVVPNGRVKVCLVFDTSEAQSENITENQPDAASRLLVHEFPNFPDIEEIKADAARKTAERLAYFEATGKDLFVELRDSFNAKPFEGIDGVAYQRKMRDEWPD